MSSQNGNFCLVAKSTEGSSSGYFTQVSEPWPVGLLCYFPVDRSYIFCYCLIIF